MLVCHVLLRYYLNAEFLAGEDRHLGVRTKEDHYREAAQFLNAGERAAAEGGEGVGGTLAFLTRGTSYLRYRMNTCSPYEGIHQLATRSMDDALRSFEGVLAEKPTNIVALLGKVRTSLFILPYISYITYAGPYSICQTKLSTSFKVVSTSTSAEPDLHT